MKIIPNPDAAATMLAAAQAAQDAAHERAPGIHVSDLIHCLRQAYYKRQPDLYPVSPPEGDNLATLLLGQGHHGLLQCEGEYEVPVLLDFDGIEVHGTVDLVLGGSLPVEIKTTRSSSRKDIAGGMAHYIDQLASYCLALGVSWGRLAIWHMMGDYRRDGPPGAHFRVWDVVFDPIELESWRQELGTRALLVSTVDPIDLTEEHYTWECGYCPFHQDKGGPCEGGKGRDTPFFAQDNLPGWAA